MDEKIDVTIVKSHLSQGSSPHSLKDSWEMAFFPRLFLSFCPVFLCQVPESCSENREEEGEALTFHAEVLKLPLICLTGHCVSSLINACQTLWNLQMKGAGEVPGGDDCSLTQGLWFESQLRIFTGSQLLMKLGVPSNSLKMSSPVFSYFQF